MSITIRRVTSEDHPKWFEMRQALWPECDARRHLAEMQDFGDCDETFGTFVAESEPGALAGFVEASLRSCADGCESRPVGYVEGIYVMPEFRGQGVGRQLIAAAERWAASRGCREMGSDCHDHNLDSVQFHERLGFENLGALVHFRREIGK